MITIVSLISIICSKFLQLFYVYMKTIKNKLIIYLFVQMIAKKKKYIYIWRERNRENINNRKNKKKYKII